MKFFVVGRLLGSVCLCLSLSLFSVSSTPRIKVLYVPVNVHNQPVDGAYYTLKQCESQIPLVEHYYRTPIHCRQETPEDNMVISTAGFSLIKSFEGCRQAAYRDSGGVLTIGYGHTGPDVQPNTFWTQQQCDTALAHDVESTETEVTQFLGESVKTTSQEQFDALTCFAYNVGTGALKESTLLRLFLAGDYYGAALQFPLWVHDGNQVLPGLVKRRIAEANLFLEGTR